MNLKHVSVLVTGGHVTNDLLEQDVSDTQHMPYLMEKFTCILSSNMTGTYFSVITIQPSKSILSSVSCFSLETILPSGEKKISM